MLKKISEEKPPLDKPILLWIEELGFTVGEIGRDSRDTADSDDLVYRLGNPNISWDYHYGLEIDFADITMWDYLPEKGEKNV